jgi:hypothetical protein
MNKKNKIVSGFIFLILLLGIITPLLSPTNLVKAQTSYIEVYVYDSTTKAPLVGATVILSDGTTYAYITDLITNINGLANFTALNVGYYYLEVYVIGHQFNDTYITIDFDGEGEFFEFYLDKNYTPGNGFIDTYIYDSETMNSIPGAHIMLRNQFSETIFDVNADGAGFYNFTGLGPGTYEVYAINDSFSEGYIFVTIDFDGEGELAEVYLNPAYTPGIGFIDVYVYDNDTLTPISGADVWLYDEYGAYIDSGVTDGIGFYNFTGLGVGDYEVRGDAINYIENSSMIYIDYDGEAEYLLLYIAPFVRTLEILSPTDSQTVERGMVLLNVDASEPHELMSVNVYVNAVYITTLTSGILPDIYVPVFENGTNTIYLEGTWMDASTADDTVVVNSINVIPMVNIEENDYLHYVQDDLINIETYEVNFTFTTWLPAFEMLTHVSYHQYNATHTIMETEYFMTVNVLNGYVSSDPVGGMQYQHFYAFGCLPPNPVLGNKTVWVPWSHMMTVNGSITWKYTEVWTLEMYSGMLVAYIEKLSNIVHYMGMPGMMEMTLTNTSIDFPVPFISDAADFDYDEGDTGNIISWTATDMFPANYTIYKDGVYEDSGFWNSVTPITKNVDGLAPGTYVYLLVVSDRVGNTAQDTVTVTVNPVVPEFESHYLIFIPILILTTHLYIWRRKKNNK